MKATLNNIQLLLVRAKFNLVRQGAGDEYKVTRGSFPSMVDTGIRIKGYLPGQVNVSMGSDEPARFTEAEAAVEEVQYLLESTV